MKKLTYIIAFCLGVALTCLCNHISLVSSASAENEGKQNLLYSMAGALATNCSGPIGKDCLGFYQYYQKLGGTNELIFEAREENIKKYPNLYR